MLIFRSAVRPASLMRCFIVYLSSVTTLCFGHMHVGCCIARCYSRCSRCGAALHGYFSLCMTRLRQLRLLSMVACMHRCIYIYIRLSCLAFLHAATKPHSGSFPEKYGMHVLAITTFCLAQPPLYASHVDACDRRVYNDCR